MNILILFGGISPEHEISVISSQTIVKNLDHNQYHPILIGISRGGKWRSYSLEDFYHLRNVEELFCPQSISLCLSEEPSLQIDNEIIPIHCAFPVLHGIGGEDGSIQGFLDCCRIPYVGCNVESSSICMNKIFTKILLSQSGIPVSPYRIITKEAFSSPSFSPQEYISLFELPLFIKDPRGGSSIGVSKIDRPDLFYPTLTEIFKNSHEALIEKAMIGREMECSVLTTFHEDNKTMWSASLPGEIIPEREFYDYAAKYLEDTTRLDIPATLTKEQMIALQSISIQTVKALGCYGLARVDCFLDSNNQIVVNEVNTIPGFTSISMYPSLWRISGIDTPKLIDQLIQTALYRKESQR